MNFTSCRLFEVGTWVEFTSNNEVLMNAPICTLCNDTYHVRNEAGKLTRCQCFYEEIKQVRLSALSHITHPIVHSPLESSHKKTVKIQASRFLLERHLKWLLMNDPTLRVIARSSNTLVDDTLSKGEVDEEGGHPSPLSKFYSVDLLIVDFNGAIKNKFLPNLMAGLIQDRQQKAKGTWLLLDVWNIKNLINRICPVIGQDLSVYDFENYLINAEEIVL